MLLLASTLVWAQKAPDWRRIGGTSVDLSLASPAGGSVDRVWFSPDGSTLYARTHSGWVLKTADFETWEPATGVSEPPRITVDDVGYDQFEIAECCAISTDFTILNPETH